METNPPPSSGPGSEPESAPNPPVESSPRKSTEQDASTGNIILYAFGNIENAFCNLFPGLLNTIMVVAFQVQPILMGVALFLKTLIDGITDPIMAHISDNAKTRFGRRKPFIMIGATGRMLTIVLMFAFFPATALLLNNQQLADDDAAGRTEVVDSVEEMDGNDPEVLADTDAAMVETTDPDLSAPANVDTPANAVDAGSTEEDSGEEIRWSQLAYEKTIGRTVEGFRVFFAEENAAQRSLVLYVGAGLILFTLFSTVVATPYYAFGIELCSSYEGRTKLVIYRSVIDKVLAILNPWVQPLVFATVFYSVIQGFLTVAIVFAILGIASTAIMVWRVPEPKVGVQLASKRPKIGFFRSLWITAKNPHFLRVFALYQVVGIAQGTFVQFAIFLNIYYVMASATGGSLLTAVAQTLGITLALLALPLTRKIADRFEKHRAILFGLSMMSIGSILTWWTVTPENPWLQLVNPFFFSIGISGFYSIMGALLADVTDVDELENGRRREGMFAAVMSLMGKVVGSAVPLLSAIMLTISGFDPTLKFDQPAETFERMRMLYAFAPLPLLGIGIWISATYPLNRAKMMEIKARLEVQRSQL